MNAILFHRNFNFQLVYFITLQISAMNITIEILHKWIKYMLGNHLQFQCNKENQTAVLWEETYEKYSLYKLGSPLIRGKTM